MDRRIRRLGIGLVALFGLLFAQLAHVQVFAADDIKGQAANARRQIIAEIRDVTQAKKMFEVLGPRYKDRNGGYTRIMKAGFRYGDSAAMAVIEFVDRDEDAKGKDSGPVEAKAVPAEQEAATA